MTRLVTVSFCLLLLAALAAPSASGDEPRRVEDLSAFMQGTLGPVAKQNAFSFAVISDTHIGADDAAERNTRALLADIAAAGVGFVIDTGDMTEGTAEQGAKLMAIFHEICGDKMPLLAVMGNHDRAGVEVLKGLYNIEPTGPAASCNYSVNVGRLHLAVVHNGQRDLLHETNAKFLAADLAAAKGRPTLLFYHIHVLCPTPGQAHLSYMGDKRYAALDFLDRFDNLKGCFAGHDHAFWAGRFNGKNFFSTVGSWYQCGGTKNGWWRLDVDGEKITVQRRQIGAKPEPMPEWDKFPLHPTAETGAVTVAGRTEIPLFADRLTAAGFYNGTQGAAVGSAEGVSPVVGERMIRCMELGPGSYAALGCEDFKVVPGDRLAYWMYVAPGGGQFTYGVRPGGGWRGFEKLADANGLPVYLCPDKAGISPGNWLYREVPLGQLDRWFSTFSSALPGNYGKWPTRDLHSSWRLMLDDVKLLRGEITEEAAPPGKVGQVKAEKVGAGYVVLTWPAVEGAHRYRVMRSGGQTEKRLVGVCPDGAFRDFTAQPKTTYTYEVAAVNLTGTAGPAASVQATTAEADPVPAKVTGLNGALLPKGRFVFAGTWHEKPAVHVSWDGKADLNDLAVKAFRVYLLDGGERKLFAETIGRYALIDEGELGMKLAVSAVNHSGQEGPAAEIGITQTWNGPGQAFHLRTGNEDAGK